MNINQAYKNSSFIIAQIMRTKILDIDTAYRKAQSYCAYQERCEQELRLKCREWGLNNSDTRILLDKLCEDDFLNEERFATAYARGKFRIKKWGKIRIRQELISRQVPSEAIKIGLKAIDEEGNYEDILVEVMQNKLPDYEGDAQKTQKLVHYTISRGFESDLVWQKIKLLGI